MRVAHWSSGDSGEPASRERPASDGHRPGTNEEHVFSIPRPTSAIPCKGAGPLWGEGALPIALVRRSRCCPHTPRLRSSQHRAGPGPRLSPLVRTSAERRCTRHLSHPGRPRKRSLTPRERKLSAWPLGCYGPELIVPGYGTPVCLQARIRCRLDGSTRAFRRSVSGRS